MTFCETIFFYSPLKSALTWEGVIARGDSKDFWDYPPVLLAEYIVFISKFGELFRS